MKQFLKMTLATICGIFIFTMIVGFFFIISIIGMTASEAASTKIQENSVFVISLKGQVTERSTEGTPFDMLLGQADMQIMGLNDLLADIRKAKEQDDIKGIYLEGGIVEFDGPATAQQLRDALKDFKQSGKWIVAYAEQYLQGAYYVASVADKVYMNSTGMLDLRGMGGKSQYLKGLYDKLGVKYQVAKVGKYKSAVEGNILTSMSEYDREQRTVMYQGIWNHWLKDISESRKVSIEQLNKMANDSIIALADAQDLVKAHLIDKVLWPEELRAEIRQRLKIDKDADIAQLTLADMNGVNRKDNDSGEEIAVYYASGEIIDEITGFLSQGETIVGSTTAADLEKLANDDNVKAVVFRVNSPGGSATASEQIRHALTLLKAKKPVVVSMGSYAASGGYWISAGANYIIAEPTTVTGSIGIFGLIPNVSGLVTDKLGITFDGVQTNKFTNWEEELIMGKENAEEMKYMQTHVERGYTQFLDIVAEGRKMKRAEVDSIAQGRVWLAKDAIKIKLVDKLGSLDDAVKKAAELAKIGEYHTKSYPYQQTWLDQFLAMEEKGTHLDGKLRLLLGDLYEPVVELRKNQERNRIQARLPYSVTIK
ncbi:MAG: signal peptide peptidase SppA [Prevotella sp.]|nr:signal peptide peptidase SppA [Prevotella sp.]